VLEVGDVGAGGQKDWRKQQLENPKKVYLGWGCARLLEGGPTDEAARVAFT
jgi:hypothetical protein